MERFVEIGVKSSPTVAGLATNTLKLPEYAHSTVEVLNAERDAAVLFATDTDPEPEPEEDEPVAESPAPDVVSEAAPVAPAASSAAAVPTTAGFVAPPTPLRPAPMGVAVSGHQDRSQPIALLAGAAGAARDPLRGGQRQRCHRQRSPYRGSSRGAHDRESHYKPLSNSTRDRHASMARA